MAIRKSYLLIPVVIVLIALGGAGYFLSGSGNNDTRENAAAKLAAQNIEINETNFFAEIKAGHAENVHYFLLSGATAATVSSDGTSALMVAVQAGDKNILSQILATVGGEDAAKILNLKDSTATGKTALIIAVEKGDAESTVALLNHGADTAATDKAGETPLIVAVKNKRTNLLPILMDADAKQHQLTTLGIADTSGETPFTYAIRGDSKDIVETLLAAKADAISPDRSGITPLMIAAEGGDTAIGAELIKAGAKPDMADRLGNSPLTIAIRHAHPEFARFLLDNGADPDFHTVGPLPLQVAITAEPFDSAFFFYLLSHSRQAGNIDASALFDAIDHKNAPLAQLLLERGLSAKTTNAKGETLLYHAIENGMQDTALLLIDKGADIRQTGISGITPLESATKHDEIKIVQKILSLGVSPEQKTSEGYTLAEMAVYRGFPEILDSLLAKGAKVEKDFCILWSIREGGGRSVPVLLKYGAHPNVMSNNGDPALWLAASAGEADAVTAFIQYHGVVDYPNTSQSMTPLGIASHGGQLAVVKLLVEAGAKLEAPDAFGMTPLAQAAYMAKPDVVEYLISKGANVHATDKQGRSVADLAGLAEASAARDRVLALLEQWKR